VEAEFKEIAKEIGFRLHVWSATTGLLDVASKSVRDCNDPLAVLLAVQEWRIGCELVDSTSATALAAT